jgi:hypothetical protein
MKTLRIPAEIILTFGPQVKVTDEVAETAEFACEQHLNSIGVINYTGPMIATGSLSFGLRVHLKDHPPHPKLIDRFGEIPKPIEKKPPRVLEDVDIQVEEAADEPQNG